MKVFTDIAQNGKSQTEVTSVTTPAGKKYYNEGNLGAATQSVTGLLTASDKTKLDGIAAGANKTVVDSSLSTSSANPVQNNIVTTALAGKAAAIHTHSYTDCIIGGGNEKEYIRSLGAKLPVVFGNVFHGLPASAVTIEKSTDSGSTWTDMGISDAVKRNLVCDLTANGIGFNIKSNVGTAYQFRVTIDDAHVPFRILERLVGVESVSSEELPVPCVRPHHEYAPPLIVEGVDHPGVGDAGHSRLFEPRRERTSEPDGFSHKFAEMRVGALADVPQFIVFLVRETSGEVDHHHVPAIMQNIAGNLPDQLAASSVEAEREDCQRPCQAAEKEASCFAGGCHVSSSLFRAT